MSRRRDISRSRKVYRITDAGLQELARRHDDRRRWEGNQGGWPDGGFEGCMREFLDRTDGLLRRVHLTETRLRECPAILDQAFERIRHTLKDTGDDKGGAPTREDRR
jgi:DNA-binding PadR family transcriptional regulator